MDQENPKKDIKIIDDEILVTPIINPVTKKRKVDY